MNYHRKYYKKNKKKIQLQRRLHYKKNSASYKASMRSNAELRAEANYGSALPDKLRSFIKVLSAQLEKFDTIAKKGFETKTDGKHIYRSIGEVEWLTGMTQAQIKYYTKKYDIGTWGTTERFFYSKKDIEVLFEYAVFSAFKTCFYGNKNTRKVSEVMSKYKGC